MNRLTKVLSALAALLVVSAPAAAQDPNDAKARKVGWSYTVEGKGTGMFACRDWNGGDRWGTSWTEYTTDKGVTFSFVQVGRTGSYVLLYDKTRKVTVMLTDTQAYAIQEGKPGGVGKLWAGKWVIPTAK